MRGGACIRCWNRGICTFHDTTLKLPQGQTVLQSCMVQSSYSPLLFYSSRPVCGVYFCSPSAGTTTPFSSSIFANEPSWCMLMRISHPPMNSLSTYSWGIVGHSEYSLIPVAFVSVHSSRHLFNPQSLQRELRRSRTCAQLLVFEHVECCELVWIDTLHAQNLYACPRETALRCLWRSLHEQDDGRGGDGAVDCAANFIGEAADLEGCKEACAWGGAD